MTQANLGKVLHVGSGWSHLPDWLSCSEEVRLDVNRDCQPDIVADAKYLGDIGGFDTVFSCHFLEHIYPHDLPQVLSEFRRVLKPNGLCIALVPDLEDIKPTEEVLYVSEAGPVTGLDMFYGMRKYVQAFPYMEHHNAFTAETLRTTLEANGFTGVIVKRMPHTLLASAVNA